MHENVWNKLLEFESRDLIEYYIHKCHDRKASARQTVEISANFTQAREYFRNAQESQVSVKPLLLYYGVMSLSVGMTLTLLPHLSQSSLKPAHGLDTLNWQQTISTKNFGELRVKFQNGICKQLLDATSNSSHFKHNSSAVNYSVSFHVPNTGESICLIELLQSLPDVDAEYLSWSKKQLLYLRLEGIEPKDLARIKYKVAKDKQTKIDLPELFPPSIFKNVMVTELNNSYEIETDQDSVAQLSQRFRDPFKIGIGEDCP